MRYRVDRTKIWCEGKAEAFFLAQLPSKLIYELKLYEVLNFVKIVFKDSKYRESLVIGLNSFP